jgi:hypothetical protein
MIVKILVLILFCSCSLDASEHRDISSPGCPRQNSNELIRDLIFSAIDHQNFDFLHTLLDKENATLSDASGKSIIERLKNLEKSHNVDVSDIIKRIETLKK